MKYDIESILKGIDGAIAVAEMFANLTETDKDNQYVAALKAFRDKFRPIFGAANGTEDLPQAVADAIDREAGKIFANMGQS